MRVGSLCTGIGGIDLGLERAGMTIAWQIEIDPWCRRVLTKHWPDVPKYGDIREVTGHELAPVDLVTAGFPCQPVSVAGKRRGQNDERWLWPEVARLIRVLRPRCVLLENVPGLFRRGMGDVLGDLAASGYDAEWSVLPACFLGAPHTRERVFIFAHSDGLGRRRWRDHGANHDRQEHWKATKGKSRWSDMERWLRQTVQDGNWSSATAAIQRVDDGLSDRLDRLRGLGNAVVPAAVEWIGRRIIAEEQSA